MRFGLCCTFLNEPIRFRRTTARSLRSMNRREALARLSEICLHNARSLRSAVGYCAARGIGSFRINSRILPLKTHPTAGYEVEELPGGKAVREAFQSAGADAEKAGIRLTFHPDQFVLLGSPREEVTEASIAELEYQGEVAEWVGADVINIHGGGAYGDKASALGRMEENLYRLSRRVRERLTLENDDRIYSPADLLPLCRRLGIGFVYDIHHHRCLPDGLTEEEAAREALGTWNREPLFHLSSPRNGWGGGDPRPHHDFIDPRDLPGGWRELEITVEVEAKAKEEAILLLMGDFTSPVDAEAAAAL